MNPPTNLKRVPLILAGILAAVLLLVLVVDRTRTDSGIDSKPEGVDIDFSTHANIVEGEDLLQRLGSLEHLESLSRDLHFFGRAAYEAYKSDPGRVVGFRVSSDVRKQDNIVEMDGHFGSSRNKVSVRVEVLKNGRISSSITDTGTGFNIDDTLPSNSKLNKFIGGLPLISEGYTINYLSQNSIEIAVYDRDPGTYDEAYAVIVEAIGEKETEKLELSVSLPSPNF